MTKKTLCTLTAIALLSIPLSISPSYAQDGDIFSQFREEEPEPQQEAVPAAPANEDLLVMQTMKFLGKNQHLKI